MGGPIEKKENVEFYRKETEEGSSEISLERVEFF